MEAVARELWFCAGMVSGALLTVGLAVIIAAWLPKDPKPTNMAAEDIRHFERGTHP